MRSPSINAQIIQQQGFMRYKELYAFLSRHHSKLAEEIGQAYINTMRWYYFSHFVRYRQALEKVSLYTVEKQDALGAHQSSQRSMFALEYSLQPNLNLIIFRQPSPSRESVSNIP